MEGRDGGRWELEMEADSGIKMDPVRLTLSQGLFPDAWDGGPGEGHRIMASFGGGALTTRSFNSTVRDALRSNIWDRTRY